MIEFLKSIIQKYKNYRERTLFPEKEYIVEFNNEIIKCQRPDGTVEIITWRELKRFEVHTNDLGPYVEDVYLVLNGDNRGFCIPQGATNSSELFSKLQELHGFNSEQFIEAMSSTSNNVFLIWEKDNSEQHL